MRALPHSRTSKDEINLAGLFVPLLEPATLVPSVLLVLALHTLVALLCNVRMSSGQGWHWDPLCQGALPALEGFI